MPGAGVYWTLVFTAASLEHLAERNIEAADVADAVYGRNGPARVRRAGRGARQRWFVMAPLDGGELLTCVFRAALPRDLNLEGVLIISSTGRPEPRSQFDSSMRLRSGLGRGRGQKLWPVAGKQGRELVSTRAEKKGRIPTFRSDREERDFWARHSVEEFAKDLEDLEVEIRPPRTEQIALRLYKEDLRVLRSLAAERGVGHTTLARTVLEGWLARSRGKRKPTRRRPVHRPA